MSAQSLINRGIVTGNEVAEKLTGMVVVSSDRNGNSPDDHGSHDQESHDQEMAELEKLVAERTSALLKMNEELERKNQELEQFAYVATHDLQEPLRKIHTFSELLIQNLGNGEAARKYYDKIIYSVERMSFLIKDVLSYSHVTKTTEPFVDIDLNYILQYIVSDFEHAIEQKKATIHFSDLPVLKGIPGQILQLFSNLISNSLKFCECDPEIRFTSRLLGHDEVTRHHDLKPGTSYVAITCSDNGIGFEPQYAEQIFLMFQRLHHRGAYGGGTGMGLAICRKIAEKHNGSITAAGEAGKGACFTIILPVK